MGCLAASAEAATALEPGVHVDPGSPAAKEYALPLSQARQTGSESPSQSGSQAPSRSVGEGALFGAGIKPPPSGGSTPAGTSPRGAHDQHGRDAHTAGGGGGAGAQASGSGEALGAGTGGAGTVSDLGRELSATALRAVRAQGSTGDGSRLALLGGGVLVLVLGGFGGTVLRHSRRPTSSP